MRVLSYLLILQDIVALSNSLHIYAHLQCHGGHFTAMTTLVSRLSKRHTVTVVTTALCPKKVDILRSDPNVTIHEHDLNPAELDFKGFFDFLYQFSQIFINENENILKTSLEYLGSGDFDVMVADAAVDGNLVAAEVHNTPAIAIVSGYQGPTENFQSSTDYLSWKIFLLLLHHVTWPYYEWREKQREIWNLPKLELKKADFCEYAGLFPMVIDASPAFYPPIHPSLEHLYTGAYRNMDMLDKIEGDLLRWVKGDNRNIVFISMGTGGVIDSSVVKLFVEEVEKQDQLRFIWAHGRKQGQILEELGIKQSKNFYFGKYLPEVDLLMHENVRAFVSHGGLHSSLDAVKALTPVICIPQYADQDYNCQKLRDLGTSVYVNSFGYSAIMEAYRQIDSDYAKFTEHALNLRSNFSMYENDEDLFQFVEKIAARKSVSRLTEYSFQYHSWWFLPVYYGVYYGVWLLTILFLFFVLKVLKLTTQSLYKLRIREHKKKK